MIEHGLRRAVTDWLRADAELSARLNTIAEEGPVPSPLPSLAIVASAGADWSSKTTSGRDIRLALELQDRSDDGDATGALAHRIEQRIATLDPDQPGFRIIVTQFLRSRVERRARSIRAVLFEYRFRILDLSTE